MRTVTLRHQTPLPVTVNGVEIAHAEIAREVQNQQAGTPAAAWAGATRALIVRELLLQRAAALGITATACQKEGRRETDEEALIGALLEAEVKVPRVDEASCRRLYEANPARFRTPDRFEPQHILLRAARTDEAGYAAALARARTVIVELRENPGKFPALAQSMSDCPSGAEGGWLGLVGPGETTPEFEAALRSLCPGEMADVPVETRYGVHVLRLERRLDGGIPPFREVKSHIAAWLEEAAWQQAMAQYVSLLVGQAKITGFAMTGAVSPLVQ